MIQMVIIPLIYHYSGRAVNQTMGLEVQDFDFWPMRGWWVEGGVLSLLALS